ncbi:hypothetical protein [Sebaldella termitidis]|nr:hypothetical protein [Sebaldella termitidis]
MTKSMRFDNIFLVNDKDSLAKRTMKIEEEANAKKEKIKVVEINIE